MLCKYVGPFDAVEIPDLRIGCAKGKSIEVPDAIGENLVLQHDWEAAAPTKTAKPADKES